MPRNHVVEVGESAPQIAARFGFADWKTIYQHADNAELRQKRTDPNMLFPGDVVAIPPIESKVFKIETGQKHRIVISRPHASLNVVVKDCEGEPLAGKKFELRVAGREELREGLIEGATTGDGCVDCHLPVAATEAQLAIWLDGDKTGTRYVWDLELGALYPPETNEGVRQRLNNLGYCAGEECNDDDDSDDDGSSGDEGDDRDDNDDVADPLSLAVAAFQEDLGLEVTGEIDDDTRSKLVDAHGGT